MTTHREFQALWLRLYPELDPKVVALDVKGLQDVPADRLVDALIRWRQESNSGFAPRPGALRELAGYRGAAELAWDTYKSLPRIPPSSDIAWHDGSGRAQIAFDAWTRFRSDKRCLAALLAARSARNTEKAFLAAYREEERRMELARGNDHPALEGSTRNTSKD